MVENTIHNRRKVYLQTSGNFTFQDVEYNRRP